MSLHVVTGGAGFVGSHLCERLLHEGHEVVCIDNMVTGSMENVAALRRYPRFHLQMHDVSVPFDVAGPVQAIFHLASPASPKDFETLQCEILAAGADGTRNALELARRKGARFVQASTSEVYGEPEVHPQPETYRGSVDTLTVRGVYDESKRFAEAAVMAWRRVHNVDARIVRIFNTYGPRMRLDDGRVLPNFLTQALRGEDLTVYGDGSQTRSFCYVDDLVDGLIRAARVNALPGPVNIGNPEEVTIGEVAREVISMTGSTSALRFLPLPKGDPKLRKPDITRAREWLGWQPTVSRQEGFERTFADMRARYEAQRDRQEAAVA